jgi:hypothetical protein
MPPVTRAWQAADFTRAAQILTIIASEDASRLPRYQSPRSGALFARLSARENVDAIHSLTAFEQLRPLGELASGLNAVLLIYIQAARRGQVFDEELAGLTAAVCHETAMMLQVAGEVLQSGLANEAGRQQIEQGYHEVIGGAGDVVAGAITTFAERATYRLQARVRFAQLIDADLPTIAAGLPPDERRYSRARLTQVASQEPDASLGNALRTLAGRF